MFLIFYNIEITNQMITFYTIVDQIIDLFLCNTSIVASKIPLGNNNLYWCKIKKTSFQDKLVYFMAK